MTERTTTRWARSLAAGTRAPVLAASLLFGFDRLRTVIAMGGGTGLRPLPTVTLLAGYIALAVVVVTIGALGWAARRAVAEPRRDARLGRVIVPVAVFAAVIAWPTIWVGGQLTEGEWISEQWFAPLVALAPLAVGLATLPFIASLALSEPTGTPRRRRAITGLLAAAAIVFLLLDHRVAVGLYPAFHLMLHVLSVVGAVLAFRRALPELAAIPKAEPWLRRLTPITTAMCIAAPLVWFGMSGPTRGALALGSPVARDWLQQTRRRADARMLRNTLAALDVTAGRYAPSGAELPRGLIDGREYNVLLIVVDALRADALPPARPEDGLPFSGAEDTPNIDAWLEGTYRFKHTYTVATKTYLAMPGLFRSVEVSDNNVTMGVPLAVRMQELGRTPVAVAIDYFFSPKYDSVAALVEGFGDMVFYEKAHNEEAVPATIEMLRGVKDERFFLWLHMYNVHDPGFDGTLLSGADCSRVECYRRSMKYLDDEIGKLFTALDELGLRDNTIVVLVADHGEGLGDHGLTLHGPNVFEEDVRVPLAFAIPNQPGGIIEEPVGTIDVAPTLVDLLGGPAEPQDRGRSLVPLMAGRDDVPSRPYFFQNMNGRVMGIVSGRDKVIYDSNVDAVYRFDLDEDPDEFDDIFDPAGAREGELLRALIEFNPKMVDHEFDDPETIALLGSRLAELDPDNPGDAAPLLIRLIDHKPDPDLVTQAVELFAASHDRGLRLLILRYLYDAAPRRFGAEIAKWIKRVANTPEELAIVDDLAAQGQAAISDRTFVARLNHYAKAGTPSQWTPYLRLMRPWQRTAKTQRDALTAMLRRARTEPGCPTSIIELVLENTSSLDIDAKNAEVLAIEVRPLLEHEEAGVRAMAIRALGGLARRSDLGTFRRELANLAEDPRVRREAASALAKVERAKAIPELIAAATDASMQVIVVRQLAKIGSSDGLPFLREIAETHYNSYLRREAHRAIERIEAGPPKKAKSREPEVRPEAQVGGVDE
jgi:hypothetical protein